MLLAYRDFRLNVKISLLGAGSVLIMAITLVVLAVSQSGVYNRLAQREVDDLIVADLDHITQSVYSLVQTEDDAVRHELASSMNVARRLLSEAGGVRRTDGSLRWRAVDQFTQETRLLHLPALSVGNRLLDANDDPTVKSPVVDEVSKMVDVQVTIFQRMDESGDMLRVATTVRTANGRRAIGTYIPAVNPDGSSNPVIATVKDGRTYTGRAFVVNAWHITAYEPLTDAAGALTGMLYVGMNLKNVESRIRQAILKIAIGKTGYVFVLGGKGEHRGRYIISQNESRDGEDIWESRDSEGKYNIQEIINTALMLGPGAMATTRYRWQNPGEPAPRFKTARLAYYEPWDWVIGTSTYDDEFQVYQAVLEDGRTRMTRFMGLVGLAITLLVILAGSLIAWTIARPIRQMTEAARTISQGELDRTVDVRSRDEIGGLANAFNLMTQKLKCTMEGLRESENNYRSIVENAVEGFFQSTLDGRFINANPALARTLGYASPEELIETVTDIRTQTYVHPEERDAFIEQLRRQQTGSGREIEFRRKDGQPIWVSLNSRIVCDADGSPIHIEGFLYDVSGRKRAEEALHESRRHFRTLFEDSPVSLIEADCSAVRRSLDDLRAHGIADLRAYFAATPEALIRCIGLIIILDVNRAALFLTKAESKADLPADLRAFAVDESLPAFAELFSVLAEDGRHYEGECLFATLRGEKVNVILHLGVIPGHERSLDKVMISLQNITERKREEERRARLEEQLEQARKMETVGLLAGGVAHDFNNLLTPILGYTEMLLDSLPAEDDRRQLLSEVQHAAEHARDLTHRLLAFSRKQIIELSTVNLGEIVGRFEAMVRHTIRENIRIEVSLSPSLSLVRADPGQIEEVLLNLSINAQDAMPDGGTLLIEAADVRIGTSEAADNLEALAGPFVRLSVSDTGTGMDGQTLGHLFVPFFTTKAPGKGTGLGLSTVYGIVSQHGGFVTVESALGKGSTFHVHLPRVEAADASVERSAPAAGEAKRGAETILVVEDNGMVRTLAFRMLERLGYRVIASQSVEHGIELAMGEEAIGLLLTDVVMPGLNGKELFERLRKGRPGLKVLFMSGYTRDVIGQHGVLDEGVHFIQKPFTIRTLSEKVRHVLDS